MKNICQSFKRVVVAAVVVTVGCSVAMADKNQHRYAPTDSVTVTTQTLGETPIKKMNSSLFPVKLQVKGSSLRVSSEHKQILPIYTQGGSLYMNVQLTRGVNWLNGLPRGSYLINNRTIRIS